MSFIFDVNRHHQSLQKRSTLIWLLCVYYYTCMHIDTLWSARCHVFLSIHPFLCVNILPDSVGRDTQQTHAMIVISTLECVNKTVFMDLHMDWYAVCKIYTEQMQIIIITNRFNIHHKPFDIHFHGTKFCLYLPKSVSLNRQTVGRRWRRRRHRLRQRQRLRLQRGGNCNNLQFQIEISNHTTVDVSWTDSLVVHSQRTHRPYKQHIHICVYMFENQYASIIFKYPSILTQLHWIIHLAWLWIKCVQ